MTLAEFVTIKFTYPMSGNRIFQFLRQNVQRVPFFRGAEVRRQVNEDFDAMVFHTT
jgi:hypothetical protein